MLTYIYYYVNLPVSAIDGWVNFLAFSLVGLPMPGPVSDAVLLEP